MFLPSPTGAPLRIGIFRSSSIGDVVLATSCLHLLSRLKIPVEVTWIGRAPSLGLLREAYPSLNCVELKKRYEVQEVIAKLSQVHFLVDLQSNLRSRLIGRAFKKAYSRPVFSCTKSYFQRGRLVLEGRMYGRRRDLPDKALKAAKPQYQVMADALFEALSRQLPPEHCDGLREGFQPFPHLPTQHDEGRRPWQKELKFGSWLAVAPGASHDPKRAPLQQFTSIIKRVREKYYRKRGDGCPPLGLLCLGDSQDRKICLELLSELGWNEPVINLAGMLTLWESALALQGAGGLLSNDSGLAHMAEAVGTPCAVLFGPTVEGFGFAPRMPESRAFSARLGCRPCSKHGKSPCRFMDQRCFHEIANDEVAEHLIGLIFDADPIRPKASSQESKGKNSEQGPFSYI